MENFFLSIGIVVVGGALTAAGTALLTSYLTSKTNKIHANYMREAVRELRSLTAALDQRVHHVESRVTILEHRRRQA